MFSALPALTSAVNPGVSVVDYELRDLPGTSGVEHEPDAGLSERLVVVPLRRPVGGLVPVGCELRVPVVLARGPGAEWVVGGDSTDGRSPPPPEDGEPPEPRKSR